MTTPLAVRRATLLGVLVAVAACDIVEFATDPKPRFEQTWNLPVSSDTISIASLLPSDNSVRITPDSSAFQLTSGTITINKAVIATDACTACLSLVGTTAPKPAFNFTVSNSVSLASDVVSATLTGGTVTVVLTNNMTFDPLRVTASGAGTQGKLKIVIKSGSQVFGVDSVMGTTQTWAPNGGRLTRNITLQSGFAPSSLTAEVLLDSPAGDAAFIGASSALNATATATLNVASVSMNVVNRTLTSDSTEIDLEDLEAGITDNVVRGALQMTITNPLSISGNVNVKFNVTSTGQSVSKTISFPTGTAQVRTVTLDRTDLDKLFGHIVKVTVSGAVNSAAPLQLTPRIRIIVSNRMILTLQTPAGGN